MSESTSFQPKYKIGETVHFYAYCKVGECSYVTSDYESEQGAINEINEHTEEDHGEV